MLLICTFKKVELHSAQSETTFYFTLSNVYELIRDLLTSVQYKMRETFVRSNSGLVINVANIRYWAGRSYPPWDGLTLFSDVHRNKQGPSSPWMFQMCGNQW